MLAAMGTAIFIGIIGINKASLDFDELPSFESVEVTDTNQLEVTMKRNDVLKELVRLKR